MFNKIYKSYQDFKKVIVFKKEITILQFHNWKE
jgi:hypothetical protein